MNHYVTFDDPGGKRESPRRSRHLVAAISEVNNVQAVVDLERQTRRERTRQTRGS